MDFHDYYEASYHTNEYIKKYWSNHFEIIDIIRGEDPAAYLSNDLHFEPNGSVSHFRPMGQNLVIAHKRI